MSTQTTPAPTAYTARSLTPVLVVDAIEPVLPFWVERLGFEKTVEVPDEGRLGFVILSKDGIEVMYQTRASVEKDMPALGPAARSNAVLFLEVSDLAAVERAMHGVELALPRRRTFYGMDEIGAREPAGNLIIFAQPAAEKP